jgi:hypothetical protein
MTRTQADDHELLGSAHKEVAVKLHVHQLAKQQQCMLRINVVLLLHLRC